jgi:hypothetical protein
MYRNMEIEKAHVKSTVLSPENATESQYSHAALKGIAMRSRETIPVPIVTLNHEGEKFLTIRRQPTWNRGQFDTCLKCGVEALTSYFVSSTDVATR